MRSSTAGALELARSGLARFNALPRHEAEAALCSCCASRRWIGAVASWRPFSEPADLYVCAAEALARLRWPDVREALAAHPRIGQRATGPGRHAAWSRAEQAGAWDPDERTADALVAANAAYEARFGHVFLIRATGRTADQMLAAALDRLDHDESTEQAVVRDELTQIVRLRLDRLLLDLAEGTRSR